MSTDAGGASTLESWLEGGPQTEVASAVTWLDTERRNARERVRTQGIPSPRQEGWRYTSLKSLAELGFARHVEPTAGIDNDDVESVLVPDLVAHRAVLVNGRYAPDLSSIGGLPDGVRVASLRAMLEQDPDAVVRYLNKLAGEGAHLFSALNTAGMEDGLVVLVDRAVRIDHPIEIIHLSVGMDPPRVAQPRYLAVLGEGAQATLIERYLGLGELPYCTNALLEVVLERNAALEHYRVQTEGQSAFHLTGFYLRQAQDSRYLGLNLGLGGTWARTDLVVRFAGPGAHCDLKGLYLAGDRQLVDYHLDVDHQVGHCASREGFKGILYGKGRAVFDGRIHVARDAQKTDAHLSNRNLLLSRSAEVDTKPQLEIFADDVKCSHGTTVGQIEPEALFYLRSRGLPEPVARRMLCLGFAGEIIDAVSLAPLRDYIAEQVGMRLEKAPLE